MNLPVNYIMLAGAALGSIVSGSLLGAAVGGGVLFILYFIYEIAIRPFDAKVDWSTDVTCCVVALHAQLAKSDGTVSAQEIRHFRDACYIEPGSEDVVSAIYDAERKSGIPAEYWGRKLADLTVSRPDVRFIAFDGLCYVAVKSGDKTTLDTSYYPLLNIIAHTLGFGRDFVDERLAYVASDRHAFGGTSGGAYGDDRTADSENANKTELVNAYKQLGLKTGDDLVSVKKAYKKKMKKLHPDALNASSVSDAKKEAASVELQKVQDAYSLLKKTL